MADEVSVVAKNEVRLYNVLFPFWMLVLLPPLWLIILPGNFLIDSLVLLVSLRAMKIDGRKAWYKRHILKVFLFGMLSDILGAVWLLLMLALEVCGNPDSLWLTIPAILLTAALIFVFGYFVTFRKEERQLRLKMSLVFAVVTAPYTFLIPTGWMYGF